MKSSEQEPFKVLTSEHMRKKHVFYNKESQRIFHMISLLILTLSSLLVSIILVPFLIFFQNTVSYTLVAIAGLAFGFIFSYMVLDLQKLEHRHHVMMGILVPLVAVLDILAIVFLTRRVADFFQLQVGFNPLYVATIYMIGMVIPYLFFSMVHHRRHHAR